MVPGENATPSRSSTGRQRLRIAPRSTSPKRRGSRPRKTFSATVRLGDSASSWWMVTMPSARAAAGSGIATASPARRMLPPGSAWCTPARIFISVDLPAPFSPIRAWTSPAQAENVTPASARDGPNVLAIARISSSGTVPGALAGSPASCRTDVASLHAAASRGEIGWPAPVAGSFMTSSPAG